MLGGGAVAMRAANVADGLFAAMFELVIALGAGVSEVLDAVAKVGAKLVAAFGREEDAEGRADGDAGAEDAQRREDDVGGALFLFEAEPVEEGVEAAVVGAADGVVEVVD